MYCSKCGTQNDENVKFCANCGNDLTSPVDEKSTPLTDDSASVNTSMESQNIDENSNNQSVEQPTIDNNQPTIDNNQPTIDNSMNNQIAMPNSSSNKTSFVDKLKSLDKKVFIIGGIIIAVVVLIIVVFLLFKNLGGDKIDNVDDINKSTSFFLKDAQGNYALFNEDGEKITDFIFKDVDSFTNGTAVVENVSDEKGVINEEGKMVIPFGKYQSIYSSSGLYKVTDIGYNSYLLNAEGKQIETMNDKDLITFIGENTYSILQTEKEYKVLNYKGDVLVTFARVENEEDEPSASSEKQYVSIFYNNKVYLLDILKGKKLMETPAKTNLCISDVNEKDDSKLVLHSCVGWLDDLDEEDEVFKYVDNGKEKFEKKASECRNVYFDSELIMCSDSEGKHILDAKGNKSADLDSLAYIDDKTYAKQTDGTFNGVDFYVDGKMKKHIDCLTLSNKEYTEFGIYKLGTYYSSKCGTTSGTYQLFKKDGSLLTETKYRSIGDFNKNGISVVSEDREKYYLINTKGEKVSGEYSRIITSSYGYFTATITDEQKVLLDETGKELVKGINIDIVKIDEDNYYATIKNSDTEYVVYNISKKKILTTVSASPKYYENYFTIVKDVKTQYYTYTKGKMFYEI